MKAKERDETIKVFEDLIKYLAENLRCAVFLCNILTYDLKKSIECGYNTRMLPNALQYLKSQRPTKSRNREHYHAPTYDRGLNQPVWWDYCTGYIIPTNIDKIRFIRHLISKLKK